MTDLPPAGWYSNPNGAQGSAISMAAIGRPITERRRRNQILAAPVARPAHRVSSTENSSPSCLITAN